MNFKHEHHHYLGLYRRYLNPRSVNVRRVLELGVAQGDSLLAWMEWFPDAQVVGVDNRPNQGSNLERCKIIEADQCDPALTLLGKFDLIVDDAGHDPLKQKKSLQMLWEQLNDGGLYVVEDIETSYWDIAAWNVMKLGGCMMEGWENPDGVVLYLKGMGDALTAKYAGKYQITEINSASREPGRFPMLDGLEAIHWHPNIVFLEKG